MAVDYINMKNKLTEIKASFRLIFGKMIAL